MTDFLEIPEFPGYWVSSDGRVFSTKWGSLKELKQTTQSKGHKQVFLYPDGGKSGVPKGLKVHRLVAQMFLLKSDPSFDIVRHLDDDPSNNDVSNLAWGTQSDNMRDAVRNGGVKTSLTAWEVLQVRELIVLGTDYHSIGKQFKVPTHVIADVATRTRKEV